MQVYELCTDKDLDILTYGVTRVYVTDGTLETMLQIPGFGNRTSEEFYMCSRVSSNRTGQKNKKIGHCNPKK